MQQGLCERGARVGVLLVAVLALVVAVHVLMVAGLSGVAASAAADDGTGNVSMYTTERPGFDDAADVERAIADGTLEEADRMVVGATVVVAVDSERIAADVDDREGPPTDAFFAALEEDAVFYLVQTNPTTMRPAKAIRLGPENATVHRSGATTYVSVDTGAVNVSWDPRQDDSVADPELRGGERFGLRYGYENDSVETTHMMVEVRAVAAELFGRFDPLAPELVNRSVAVRVDPDEEVLVRMTLEDGSTRTAEPAHVEWSGFRGVTLDLRDVAPGTAYTVEIVHDGEVVDSRNGTVREPAATLAEPTLTAAGGDEYAARLNLTTELSHGGAVVVTDGEGDRVGLGRVPPGEPTGLSVGLRYDADAADEFRATELQARAVREVHNGELPYPGADATTTLAVDDLGWMPVDDPASPTATATTRGTGGADSPTDDQGPGFLVSGLVAAVACLGYLLRRRAGRRGRR